MDNKNVLIINGSIRGSLGNSGVISNITKSYLEKELNVNANILNLAEAKPSIKDIYELLVRTDGFVIVSGVYWNNWGSPLQRFIEVTTAFENSPAFFGKPLCCAISMDSVGGIELAGRVHSVFSGLGCWSPPCSSLVVSRVGTEAIANSINDENSPNEDVWRLEDVKIILKNLNTALNIKNMDWVSWPHLELPIREGEWPNEGILDLQSPIFL